METNDEKSAASPRNCASLVARRCLKAFSIVPVNASPVQWKFLLVSAMGIFAQSLQLNTVFPFIAQLLRHIGIEETALLYHAGLASTSYYCGAFVGSYLCGFLSDYLGRRPVILCTLATSMFISFLLAFCTSFPMLISARVLAGFVNGSFVAHKALISDVSDASNLAVGFCFYVLGWCLSSVVGSSVGGLLSEPALKYPSSVFARFPVCREYPYFLPCLVIAIINLIAFIVSVVLLAETKGFAPPQNSSKTEGAENQSSGNSERCGQISSSEGRSKSRRAAENSPISYWPCDCNLNRWNNDNHYFSKSNDNNNALAEHPRRKRHHTYGAYQGLEDAYCVEKRPQFLIHDSLPTVCMVRAEPCNDNSKINNSKINNNNNSFRQNNNLILHNDLNDYPAIDAKGESTPLLPENEREFSNEVQESLFGRGPLTVMLLYGVYSCIAVAADEITPAWTATNTRYGGLNFTTTQTGMMTGSPAIFIVLLSLYVAPVLISQLGVRCSCLMGLLALGIALPAITLGEFMGSMVVPYMCLSWTLAKLGGALTFITLACLCCSCVSRSKNGAMNGAATSISYFARILGPYLAGYLYNWSIAPLADGSQRSFPFDFHLAFLCLDVGIVFCMSLAFFLLKIFETE